MTALSRIMSTALREPDNYLLVADRQVVDSYVQVHERTATERYVCTGTFTLVFRPTNLRK